MHIAKAMNLLGHSEELARRLAQTLIDSDASTLDTVLLAAPLCAGVGDNGKWSIEAAAAARSRGKPVTLMASITSKRTDVEIATGKYRLTLEA